MYLKFYNVKRNKIMSKEIEIELNIGGIDLTISGEYYPEEPNLEPNWRKSSLSAPVVIKVSKKTSGLINRNCK